MAIKFTQEQLKVIKQMVVFAENFADQMYKIMIDHHLDTVDGCGINICVNPRIELASRYVAVGSDNSDAGIIRRCKGDMTNEKYKVTGKNSLEYEILFADDELRKRILDNLKDEPPLPPDGLWLSACDDDPDVDCRV